MCLEPKVVQPLPGLHGRRIGEHGQRSPAQKLDQGEMNVGIREPGRWSRTAAYAWMPAARHLTAGRGPDSP